MLKEFLNLDHIILMQISFIIMLSLTIISLAYLKLIANYNKTKYVFWGNVLFSLLFLTVFISISTKFSYGYIIVAVLDLSAIILWMMAVNTTALIKQPIKLYLLCGILNVILVYFLYNKFLLLSLARLITSFFVVIIIFYSLVQYLKNTKINQLNTARISIYILFSFLIFKIVVMITRLLTMNYENQIYKMSIFNSVNILTLVSLIFAIWINFAIIFLKYDVLNNEVKKLSLIDFLTKLPNRRKIMIKLEEFRKMHKRDKLNFALAILDLDDFKKVNDTYGHIVGDEVLKDFSKFLNEEIREIDFVGRYGGEEFIIIICENSFEQAKVVFNRINQKLSEILLSSLDISITMSGGAVFVGGNKEFEDINKILMLADERLYIAKENGKNQIIYYS